MQTERKRLLIRLSTAFVIANRSGEKKWGGGGGGGGGESKLGREDRRTETIILRHNVPSMKNAG